MKTITELAKICYDAYWLSPPRSPVASFANRDENMQRAWKAVAKAAIDNIQEQPSADSGSPINMTTEKVKTPGQIAWEAYHPGIIETFWATGILAWKT